MQQDGCFWYGSNSKYTSKHLNGKNGKYFELEGAELKNYDSIGFTVVPAKGPVRLLHYALLCSCCSYQSVVYLQNAGEQMIFQGLPMKSKRIPDWIDCIKEILGILESSEEDDDEEEDEDDSD